MGWDPMFKLKHNLEISSIDILIADLKSKLNCEVVKHLDNYDKETAKEFGIDTSAYDNGIEIQTSNASTIFVADDLFFARSLIMMYGIEDARELLNKHPNKQYLIDSLYEVQSGVIRYNIDNGSVGNTYGNQIWSIGSETLSGSPDFPGRWSLFNYLFSPNYSNYRDETWTNFLESRKKLYDYIQPIIKETPAYYHSDQGPMELLIYTDKMQDFEKVRLQQELTTFSISKYILNPKSETCKNPYGTVFIDDFNDITRHSILQ